MQDEDNYQNKVIAPNLLRLLDLKDIKENIDILDIGCGQGFFIEKILKSIEINTSKYINIYGIDLSADLIKMAINKFSKYNNIHLKNGDASKLSFIKSESIDKVFSVLALQNMEKINEVVGEINRVLKNNGKCILVLNHPMFRIPKESDWYFDNTFRRQGRVVYNYMSDRKYAIDMNPGQKEYSGFSQETLSFHHPLQFYSKIFNKNNLLISKIEEWISHKKSQEGSKKTAEDNARKEIPMFMCIELTKVDK